MSAFKYYPGKLLARGGFAEVRELEGCERLVIKIEEGPPRALKNEYKIYRLLKGISAVPNVRSFGKLGERHAMVMENAGMSLMYYLQRLHNLPDVGMRQAVVALLASSMIEAVQAVHLKGVIHGDIHPGNVMAQRMRNSVVAIRLIDFGAAIQIGKPRDAEPGVHINYTFASPERTSTPSIGPSVADDLVALGYTVIYLLTSSLPWQDMLHPPRDVVDLKGLSEFKYLCSAELFLVRDDLPPVFYNFLSYVLSLETSVSVQEVKYNRHACAFRQFAHLYR